MVRPVTKEDEVEKNMTGTLYQYLHSTDIAADIFSRFPDASPDESAKIMADGAMDGKIGKYVRQITNDCPHFKKIAKKALYQAFLQVLQEYKWRMDVKEGGE